MTSDLA